MSIVAACPPSPGQRSYTSHSWPSLASRCAAANPPAPAPTTATFMAAWLALGLDDRERVAGGDRGADRDRQIGHRARLVGGDLVLHLHRLDDRDQGSLLDLG